ncbi:MAG TPA: hypothetical protein VE870_05515, partial [Bacteroidales bacterium]|nr:hypothetical protein [Bacteroidales bacterium]
MRYFSLLLLSCLLLLLPQAKAAEAQHHLPAHLDTALTYVGTIEQGHNAGPEVSKFLSHVGLPVGNPYCASFVSYDLDAAHVTLPTVRTPLATRFITSRSVDARLVLRGAVSIPPGTIVIWRHGNSMFGHAGLVVSWHNQAGITVEANTTQGPYAGARQGIWIRR